MYVEGSGCTCTPKAYKMAGYDSLAIGHNHRNGRFWDPQVGYDYPMAQNPFLVVKALQ